MKINACGVGYDARPRPELNGVSYSQRQRSGGIGMPLARVRNLGVFLASPGGLDAERDAVEAVASVMNSEIALAHRVVITVRRWEQMIGTAGNPQSQINPRVDDCDIFIGIVYRRWGTSTGNGFDSGFGEEFARALDRWERTGEPRIALFFKEIDGDSLRDPGEQLKKVLEFRNSIEESHAAFFNLFRVYRPTENEALSANSRGDC